MTKRIGRPSRIYIALIFLFLYLPIAVLIFFSFNESKSRNVFTGFSLKWYGELFNNDMVLKALGTTLLIALVASIIATILGTAAAVGIRNLKKWRRAVVMNVTYVPVVNPEIVTGVSMLLLFVALRTVLAAVGASFEMGLGTLIIAHITFSVPYVILSVSPKLRQMDTSIYDAALDLGCNPAQAFFKVVLPEIMPGITTGFLMALTYSIDDFVISYFTSGTVQTLPIAVYSMTRRKVSPEINALSTLLFVAVLTILLIMNIRDIKGESKDHIAQKNKKPGRKKPWIYAAAAVAVIALLIAFVPSSSSSAPELEIDVSDYEYYQQFRDQNITLDIYNWGEYISDGSDDSLDVIREFEKLTGISVHYTTFATNEEMYAKIKSDGAQYDVIIPSDYMIARMIDEDMVEALNYSNIPNAQNISDLYTGLDYDSADAYSVPYMWGIVGLIYNTTMADEIDSWDALWDPQYAGNILMFSNSRDAFGISLARLGYSMNTTDPDELEDAADELKLQKSLVQAYVMDEIFNKMEGGEAAIAPYYAGDALTMIDENPDLAFVVPTEGTNYFVDAMVIPTGSPNKAAAEMFINFMCEVEVSAANAEYIGYSTPIPESLEIMDLDEETLAIAYPDEEVLARTEVFRLLPDETNRLLDSYWTEILSFDESANQWLAPVFLIVAFLASIVILIVRGRKKKLDIY